MNPELNEWLALVTAAADGDCLAILAIADKMIESGLGMAHHDIVRWQIQDVWQHDIVGLNREEEYRIYAPDEWWGSRTEVLLMIATQIYRWVSPALAREELSADSLIV